MCLCVFVCVCVGRGGGGVCTNIDLTYLRFLSILNDIIAIEFYFSQNSLV